MKIYFNKSDIYYLKDIQKYEFSDFMSNIILFVNIINILQYVFIYDYSGYYMFTEFFLIKILYTYGNI